MGEARDHLTVELRTPTHPPLVVRPPVAPYPPRAEKADQGVPTGMREKGHLVPGGEIGTLGAFRYGWTET